SLLFSSHIPYPPRSTLFPYTTLFRSVYHFVLTYSNWESVTLCFSESFESLSAGLQNALWELSSVPERHRSDRMSSAVNNLSERRDRKSTRLNSSHSQISYAVFCLKKK